MKFKFIKKAAMFGLDARIALAIFGALSVISGAALYNAIQDAKAIALLAEMNEVIKAYESYYLDTGHKLPKGSGTLSLAIGNLIENDANFKSWKGPYIMDLLKTGDSTLFSAKYGSNVHFYVMDNVTLWGGNVGTTSSAACDDGEICETWIRYDRAPINLMSYIDVMVDGVDDAQIGNFKYNPRTDDTTKARAFLKLNI